MTANFNLDTVFNFEIVKTLLGWALILLIASGIVFYFRKCSGDPNANDDFDHDTSKLALTAIRAWDVIVTGTGSVLAFILALVCIQTRNPAISALGIFGAGWLMSQLPFVNGLGSIALTPVIVSVSAIGFSIILTGPIPNGAYLEIAKTLFGVFGLGLRILLASGIVSLSLHLISIAFVLSETEEQTRWIHPWLRPIYARLLAITEKRRERDAQRIATRKAHTMALTPNQRLIHRYKIINIVLIPFVVLFLFVLNLMRELAIYSNMHKILIVFMVLTFLLIPVINIYLYFDWREDEAKRRAEATQIQELTAS